MTESEWLASVDPAAMLESLKRTHQDSERKLRLFACACCRAVLSRFTARGSREAIDQAERYADGDASDYGLECAYWKARVSGDVNSAASMASTLLVSPGTDWLKDGFLSHLRVLGLSDRWQANLVREVFGNPFRPIPGDRHEGSWYVCEHCGKRGEYADDEPRRCRWCGTDHVREWRERDTWISLTVHDIARGIYSTQYRQADFTLDPERLQVLSDAIEEAGCTDRDLLDHLRCTNRDRPHYRGCWVVDLILHKS
jgi:hypothetical protein